MSEELTPEEMAEEAARQAAWKQMWPKLKAVALEEGLTEDVIESDAFKRFVDGFGATCYEIGREHALEDVAIQMFGLTASEEPGLPDVFKS